jgi:hypothetical protein
MLQLLPTLGMEPGPTSGPWPEPPYLHLPQASPALVPAPSPLCSWPSLPLPTGGQSRPPLHAALLHLRRPGGGAFWEAG